MEYQKVILVAYVGEWVVKFTPLATLPPGKNPSTHWTRN